MVKVIRTIDEARSLASERNGTLGIIPSLGNFHLGHQSLFKKSVEQNDLTMVCNVLTPIIFNDLANFTAYPRTPEKDLVRVAETGADILFIPSTEELFLNPFNYSVVETEFSNTLEGKNRPAHFDGVLTVILKLLLMLKPDNLYLGEKDFQQLELIRGMCQAFYISSHIVACPIIRSDTGLAYSSRNSKLNKEQLSKAAHFPKLLASEHTPEEIAAKLTNLGFAVQYIEEHNNRRYGAVILDSIRLIDNVDLT